jgi:ABC-type polar amino acid transport system ATPase subunit
MAMLDRYRTSSGRMPGGDASLLDVELIDPTLERLGELQQLEAAEQDDPPAIELRHVSTFFGQFCALDDVNMVVERGQVIGIIGPSGSGKSTLIRTINQLHPQSLGQVKVFGVEATDNQYDLRLLRQTVGMVFQNFNLFPQFSVLTNVTVALRLVRNLNAAEAEELAMAALQRVSMGRHAAKKPDQLSGGEQQRVAIARAIAAEPSILLLDEPTASIDPELTKGVMRIVAEIAATDVTVVTVTHEMGFVGAVADHVIVLDGGKIVEQGPPAQVLRSPQHEPTQRFLNDLRYTA